MLKINLKKCGDVHQVSFYRIRSHLQSTEQPESFFSGSSVLLIKLYLPLGRSIENILGAWMNKNLFLSILVEID